MVAYDLIMNTVEDPWGYFCTSLHVSSRLIPISDTDVIYHFVMYLLYPISSFFFCKKNLEWEGGWKRYLLLLQGNLSNQTISSVSAKRSTVAGSSFPSQTSHASIGGEPSASAKPTTTSNSSSVIA